MWNEPTEGELRKLPKLYETEPIRLQEKIVHMHFFVGGCDWYVCEYDKEKRIFFGFAILNGDMQNAEWGYVNLHELIELRVPVPVRDTDGTGLGTLPMQVERDLHWKLRKAEDVDKIAQACGWKHAGAGR